MVQTRSQQNPDQLKILKERFPLIFEKILFNLDTKTIVKCTQVSKYFNDFIKQESNPIQTDIQLWKTCMEERHKKLEICKELEKEELKLEEKSKEIRNKWKSVREEKRRMINSIVNDIFSKRYRKTVKRSLRPYVDLCVEKSFLSMEKKILKMDYKTYAPDYVKALKAHCKYRKLQRNKAI